MGGEAQTERRSNGGPSNQEGQNQQSRGSVRESLLKNVHRAYQTADGEHLPRRNSDWLGSSDDRPGTQTDPSMVGTAGNPGDEPEPTGLRRGTSRAGSTESTAARDVLDPATSRRSPGPSSADENQVDTDPEEVRASSQGRQRKHNQLNSADKEP